MFLRLKTTPKETCEPHELGWPKFNVGALQNLARADITLVSLNPELQHDPICKDRRYGLTCPGHGRRIMVQWGPAPIKQCHSLFDTYISDPPCKYAEVCLTVRFKKQELRGATNSDAEYPIKLWASHITASSDSGLTFRDVLRAGLNARGQTECKDDFNFPSQFEHHIENDIFRYRTFSWARNLSLREVVGLLPEYTKIPEVLDCVLMELKMTLLDDIAAPTPQECAELMRRGSNPTRIC
jgi:hypothetical protein